MTKSEKTNAKQRTDAWLSARLGRLTASNVGAVLGLSPYMSRDDVMRSMVREWHGAESEFTGNVATQYGTFHEESAKADYELYHGDITDEYFVEYEDWLGASPDGRINPKTLIEIKCPYSLRNGGGFKPLSSYPHYEAQIQVQMICTDTQYCAFYQWAPHGERIETVGRRDFDLAPLRAFYDKYLIERENPEPHLGPRVREITTNRAMQLASEYEQLGDAAAQANERRKEILEELVAISGGENAIIDGKKLSHVERKGSVSYAKAAKDHLPDLDLGKYTGSPSEYWVFK